MAEQSDALKYKNPDNPSYILSTGLMSLRKHVPIPMKHCGDAIMHCKLTCWPQCPS